MASHVDPPPTGHTGMSDLERGMLQVMIERGTATRRLLAETIGVSFQTVSTTLADLSARGLIAEIRRVQGPRGRSTLVYGPTPSVGWVLGVDVGRTQVGAGALDLATGTSTTRTAPVGRETDGIASAAALASDLLALRDAPPLAVCLAVNRVVPAGLCPAMSGTTSDPERAIDVVKPFTEMLALPGTVPVIVENNVNCAAVAEHEDGEMKDLSDCAYLQVGESIGMGFFNEGMLVRGGNGASGEIARIPVSWDTDVPSPPAAVELLYGGRALLDRARASLQGTSGFHEGLKEFIAQADVGVPEAVEAMRHHAGALARLALGAAAILDPSVLVIGGGLSESTTFVSMIREEFSAHVSGTELRVSGKGVGATLEGALVLARDQALTLLLGDRHRPLLTRPVLWAND